MVTKMVTIEAPTSAILETGRRDLSLDRKIPRGRRTSLGDVASRSLLKSGPFEVRRL